MKLKYVSIIAGVGLMALSSCNDYLDKTPDTRVYLQNVEQLRKLLVNGYMVNDYACVCELASDNIADNTAPDSKGNRYNLSAYSLSDNQIFAWEDVTLDSGSDTPYSIWESCYQAIAVANAVLEKADEFEADGATPEGPLTEQDKMKLKAVRAEALLIRAYHHFILANVFCMPYAGPELGKSQQGLPYMKHPETDVSPQYERGNLADFYANIEADLKEALPIVTDQFHEVPRYHFNRAAANAFAARFYLWIRDYENAKKYADIALGDNPYVNMNPIWRTEGMYNRGEDDVRANSGLSNPSIYMSISTYSTWSRRQGERYGCKDDALNATLRSSGPTWSGQHRCFSGMVFYFGGNPDYGESFLANWWELFEYTDKLAGIGYVHMMRNEFTVEETMLVRAEAEIFLNDLDGALNDLKMWVDNRDNCKSPANVINPLTAGTIERFYNGSPGYGINKPMHIDEVAPNSKYSVTEDMVPWLQCVQHFRRIETIHKGNRFFDLKRYGIEVTHKIGKNRVETLTVGDPRWAIQLPYEVWIAGMEKNKRNDVPTPPGDQQDYQLAN